MLRGIDELVTRLWENARILRAGMQALGFDTGHSQTPIVPLMLGEAPLAQQFSRRSWNRVSLRWPSATRRCPWARRASA
jgi:glycine C-acetyltransferase